MVGQKKLVVRNVNRRPLYPYSQELPEEDGTVEDEADPSQEYRWADAAESVVDQPPPCCMVGEVSIMASCLSILLYLGFWRIEFKRIKEEWVRMALARMQPSFNFGR